MRNGQAITLFEDDGNALLINDVLPDIDYIQLRQNIDWQQEYISLFGKTHLVRRLTAYYGDISYRYSGVVHPVRPLPGLLANIKAQVETLSGNAFNAVLCNLYRDGQDRMGYHRDNEKVIDPACIASVSFGASRTFKMRHRKNKTIINITLENGSLLLMRQCQDLWEHALPASKKITDSRINLTFRKLRIGNNKKSPA